MRICTLTFTLLALFFIQPALALDWEDGAVLVRVVDVDAGECIVIKIAGKDDDHHYVVYDAGNFVDKGKTAIEAIRKIVPEDDVIDMLVLSHTDSDHVAAVPLIVDEYYIDRVIRTGQKRQKSPIAKSLKNARTAIQRAVDEPINSFRFGLGMRISLFIRYPCPEVIADREWQRRRITRPPKESRGLLKFDLAIHLRQSFE